MATMDMETTAAHSTVGSVPQMKWYYRLERGDTIGCGIKYHSNGGQIFFVKNGTLLMDSFHSIDKRVLRKGLYPAVGIDSKCPIHVNFRQVSFKFDVSLLRDSSLHLFRSVLLPGQLEWMQWQEDYRFIYEMRDPSNPNPNLVSTPRCKTPRSRKCSLFEKEGRNKRPRNCRCRW